MILYTIPIIETIEMNEISYTNIFFTKKGRIKGIEKRLKNLKLSQLNKMSKRKTNIAWKQNIHYEQKIM